MNKEMWEILGIEETRDEEAIINAYREKIVTVNPEDDQEGFIKLRQAFETAREYALNGDKEEKNEGSKERYSENDEVDAAVKAHIKDLEIIYSDIKTRRDKELWSQWLADDICTDLDTVDAMTEAVLVFLMRNNLIPLEMWQMMDKTFHFIDNKEHLLEKFRSDYLEFVEIRCKEDDYGDYYDYVDRDVYYELFSDIIPEISVYAEEKRFEPISYMFEEDEYIHNMRGIGGYFNSYFDSYLYDLKEDEKTDKNEEDNEYKQEMKNMLTIISNILERADKSSLFTPVELGARLMLLELEGKEELAFKLALKVFDRWETPHFYATNNAMKIIIKNIDKVDDKDEMIRRIVEKVEKLEELHPEYNSTKKVRFALLMLEEKYKKAEKKIKEILNENSGDLEAVIFFRIVSKKEEEIFDKSLKEGNVTEKEKHDAAWRYYQNMDIDRALELLEQIKPEEEFLFNYNKLIGICYSEKKRYKEAEPYLRKWEEMLEDLLLRKDSLNEEDQRKIKTPGACYITLANCLIELGKKDEAEAFFKKDVETTNKEEEFRFKEAYGNFLQKEGRYAEAIKIWDELIGVPSLSLLGYIHRQETAYKMKRAQMVIDDYYEIINRYNKYGKAYYYAADVFNIYGQSEEADKIIRLAEENEIDSDMLRLVKSRVLRDTQKEHENEDAVIKLYDEILENIEKNTDEIVSDAKEELEAVYGDISSFYLYLKNEKGESVGLKRAEHYIEKGLEHEPNSWRLLFYKAKLTELKHEDAEVCYNRLITLFSEYARPYFEYAEYLNNRDKKGDAKRALNLYKKVVELDPEYPEVNFKLMQLYAEKYGDSSTKRVRAYYDEAVKYAAKQIEIDPDPYYYIERGFVYYSFGDFDRAIQDALHVIEEDPEHGYAYNLLGKAYIDKKEYDKAIEPLLKAIEILKNERTYAPYNNIVRALESVGRIDEALYYLDKKNERFSTKDDDIYIYLRLYKKKNDKENIAKLRKESFIKTIENVSDKKINTVVSAYINILKTYIQFNETDKVIEYEKKMEDYLKEKKITLSGRFLGKDLDNDSLRRVYDLLGSYYLFEKREYKKARQCYLSWHKFDDHKIAKANERISQYVNLADSCMRLKKKQEAYDAALKGLQIIIDIYKDYDSYVNDPYEKPIRLNQLARLLYYAKRKSESGRWLDDVEKSIYCNYCNHCKCYDRLLTLANFAELEGRKDDAIELLKQAYEIAPDDMEVIVSLRTFGVNV